MPASSAHVIVTHGDTHRVHDGMKRAEPQVFGVIKVRKKTLDIEQEELLELAPECPVTTRSDPGNPTFCLFLSLPGKYCEK